ncbi:ImcF-related family protein, partial [Paraburkholderia fungorum]|uniref:ImcF-related family protein n=1 Tax=Paraburkholderia fungorum TaxID=134537 RepID=UPI0038BB178C
MKIEPKPNNIKDLVRLQRIDPPASEVKPIGVWGIALVIIVLALVALAFVWFKGDWVHAPLLEDQKTASLWILGVLTAMLMLTMLCSRIGAFRAIGAVFQTESGADSLEHPVGELSKRDAALRELRAELRAHFGWRWRYRLPWLLLAGDDAAIGQLIPELTEHRCLVMQDVVLLWNRTDTDEQPDTAWLKQLYKLRRRRPVDAIVLTLDGTADLSTQRRGTNTCSVMLSRIADALHWFAPVYVLDVAQTVSVTNGTIPVIGCELSRAADAPSIENALLTVRNRLADLSVAQLSRNGRDNYAAKLSERLDTRSAPLARWIASLTDRRRHQPVSGVFFAPRPMSTGGAKQHGPISADLPIWRHLSEAARSEPGRRIGWHPVTVFSTLALTAIGVWTAGMLASGLSNARDLQLASQAVGTLNTAPDSASRLRALLALQQQIARYEDRTQHHAPLLTRFGLNHDNDVLAALWPAYAQASKRTLIDPLEQNLEAQLVDLSQMQASRVDDQTSQLALDGHKALKTYLMMSNPSRAD